MTAWHRLDMLLISLRMVSWGMTLQSSNNASSNSWSVWGWCRRLWKRLPIKSQRCSIQFRSGLCGGQSMTWIPESSRKRVVTLEVCALAPSCINTKYQPISCANGRMWFCTTSTYLSAVKFPRMKMRSVLFKEIPPQTISDPLPYATVCSKLGGRFSSPLHCHTLAWPVCPRKQEFWHNFLTSNIKGIYFQYSRRGLDNARMSETMVAL